MRPAHASPSTAKRKLKRKVRERQTRTGERYTAARRQLLAERSGAAAHTVNEVVAVAEPPKAGAVLAELRDALIGNPGDPANVRLFGAAFGIRTPGEPREQPEQRMYAASGRLAEPASMITFRVPGSGGLVPVLCMLWGRALVLNAGDGITDYERFRIAMERAQGPGRLDAEIAGTVTSMFESGARQRVEQTAPRLFVIHDGRRYPITANTFVIGSDPRTADLAIRDGMVSRKHAAVIHRNGSYYLKDLGSTHGIHYKGMRIDNKRIDEGDVFQLGEHELRFTYRKDG